jgi:NAD(P)-dependent dehydrogenase (short-subunit alcohol dehydrogenase family)
MSGAPVLVIGATRGLGAALTKQYANAGRAVFGTTRSSEGPKTGGFPAGVKWVPNIDLTQKQAGANIAKFLKDSKPLGTVVCN